MDLRVGGEYLFSNVIVADECPYALVHHNFGSVQGPIVYPADDWKGFAELHHETILPYNQGRRLHHSFRVRSMSAGDLADA